MAPVLERYNGIWVGCNDSEQSVPTVGSVTLHGVALAATLAKGFRRFANRTLWPALHGMGEHVEQREQWWEAYRAANEIFAGEVARIARRDATVWVQDYHLLLVPAMLERLRPYLAIGLFIHTPVADPAMIAGLDRSDELLRAMSAVSLIGTQRVSDAEHLRLLLSTREQRGASWATRVQAHPVSIDVDRVVTLAQDPAVNERAGWVRDRVAGGRRIILGVDRVDYTKGLQQRLSAFEQLLALGAVSPDDVVFIQIASPSRTDVPAYRELGRQLKTQADLINTRYLSSKGPVVQLISDNVAFREVVAFYLAAEVAVVTPHRDGMNLVAKEFVTARGGDAVSLVLSVGAGAVDELGQHVVLVDSADTVDIAAAIYEALNTSDIDRRNRSSALARIVAARNVHDWADGFVNELNRVGPTTDNHIIRTQAIATAQ